MWPVWASTSLYTAFILCTASVPLMFLDPEGDSQTIYLGVAIPLLTCVCAFVNYILISRPLNRLLEHVDATLEQRQIAESHQRTVLKRTKEHVEAEALEGGPTTQPKGSAFVGFQHAMKSQQRLIDELGASSSHSEIFHLQAHVKDLFQALIREQQALYKMQVDELVSATVAARKADATNGPHSPPSAAAVNGVGGGSVLLSNSKDMKEDLLITPIRGVSKSSHATVAAPKEAKRLRGNEIPPPGKHSSSHRPNHTSEPPLNVRSPTEPPPPSQNGHTAIDVPTTRGRPTNSPQYENSLSEAYGSCDSSDSGVLPPPRDVSSLVSSHSPPPHQQKLQLETLPETPTTLRHHDPSLVNGRASSSRQDSVNTSGMRSPSQIVPSPTSPHSNDQLASLGVTTPLILDRGGRFKGDHRDHCMYMSRHQSGDLVVYGGQVEPAMAGIEASSPALNLERPVEGFWLKLDERSVKKNRAAGKMDDRAELSYVQESFVFGIKVNRMPSTTKWKVSFSALKKRPVVLQMEKILLMDNTGNYGTGSVVDVPVATFIPTMRLKLEGVECILEKIYVHAVDRKWSPMAKVEYVELHGWSVATGDKVMEVVRD